eukprot:1194377-Prorocentrum_minimum.AAC.4
MGRLAFQTILERGRPSLLQFLVLSLSKARTLRRHALTSNRIGLGGVFDSSAKLRSLEASRPEGTFVGGSAEASRPEDPQAAAAAAWGQAPACASAFPPACRRRATCAMLSWWGHATGETAASRTTPSRAWRG